ncbi:MAG: trypsin-like peptidase domain-containing protein [Clostridia bacterium]|nr:trypsin-like peptidase domain-containing protein [Clostridia bacterium]
MRKKIMALLLAIIMVSGVCVYASAERDITPQEELALDLKKMGLFKGVSDTEFELDRAPTRIEAVVMLIRALGKEEQALSAEWEHPFTDVPDWADKYVGYAYKTGISNGTSETTFGTETASAEMYITFMLRALGYSDKNGQDFVWDNPFTLARNTGIYPIGLSTTNFLRADAVMVTYAALAAQLKESESSLANKLISEGVFSKSQFDENYKSEKITLAGSPVELTAEQIYARCSAAVFYIEVFDENNYMLGTGSGFFVDEYGTAITNYHVIDGAVSASVTLSSNGDVYEVLGVYDYSKEDDWAVIKVDGSGFPYLMTGDASTAVGGATVYAIGSPLGLQNTISQGIISNPKRVIDGKNFLQTSAAISQGSSGGALINKYGDVIGITSAKFVAGENLSLAVPMTTVKKNNTDSVTTLKELFGRKELPQYSTDGSLTREEQAYNWLVAFITTSANTQIAGYPAFEIIEPTEYGEKSVALILQDGFVAAGISEDYNGSYYFCAIALSPGDKPYVYYTYEGSSGFYGFKGTRELDAENYIPFEPIYFDEIEGEAEEDLNASICGDYVSDTLAFVEAIFIKYISEFGDFGIADLGFTNFK